MPGRGTEAGSGRRTQAERIQATRRLIVNATIELLAEHGYEATTFAAISARAGISRGGLLHHFPDKTELLVGAFSDAIDEAFDSAGARIAALPDGDARLEPALDIFHQLFHSQMFQAAVTAHAVARREPALTARLRPLWDQVTAKLEEIARTLFSPEIAADPELALLMRFIHAGLAGLSILDWANPTAAQDRDEWDYMRARYLELLQRRTEKPLTTSQYANSGNCSSPMRR